MLLALASPEIEVLAIIVTYGNTDSDACYLNILRLYEVLHRHLTAHPEATPKWPGLSQRVKTTLALGATKPLTGDLHSAQYFHGLDGLGDITNRYPQFNPVNLTAGQEHPHLILTKKSGVDVALELIQSNPSQSITYLVLGPMTTLSQLVEQDGDLFNDRIGRVVCMGGALDVPGNTTPVAEFNFFADPYAVHNLLVSETSRFPLSRFILLPLDITTPHELPFPYYATHIDPSFGDSAKSKDRNSISDFTSAFLERTREVMLTFGKDAMELHDITAVWCAIANTPLVGGPSSDGWSFVRRKFQIERTGELTRGMLVVDRREDPGAYAPGANRAQVQAELEKHGEFRPHGVLESVAVPAQVEVESSAQAHPSVANGHGEVTEDLEGVIVVRNTPGPDALLRLLAERVWGVKEDRA